MKIYIESLGCPRNQVDSEVFCGIACHNKGTLTDNPFEADVILINTCGFIKDAKEESLETIIELSGAKKKNARLFVTGCLVKRYCSELQKNLPEVDAFIGLKDYDAFAELLQVEFWAKKRSLLSDASYAYLKISDGCENYCSYCSIPLIRGNVKSETISSLIDEANFLAEQGIRELIVTAMDISQYGIDLSDGDNLLNLLQQLVKIDNIKWIRLLYLHPANINKELLRFMKENSKICPYLDLPIQHINDDLLKSMNRRTSRKDIEKLIALIRTEIPEIALRTSLITGYPGETEHHHRELLDFISNVKFNRLGVFTYSREEDTPAFMFSNRVHPRTALRRKRELMQLQEGISEQLLSQFVGKQVEAIVDSIDEENDFQIEARTRFDAPDIDGVVFVKSEPEKPKPKVADIVKILITDSMEHDLIGKILE
jgi:ribosomal protein S12 methylthiotransferase